MSAGTITSYEIQPQPAEPEGFGFDWDAAPVLEIEIDFDTALDRAAAEASDAEAFAALEQNMEAVYESGDMDRLQAMAIQLGAMACLCPELQQVSTALTEKFGLGDELDGHSADDGHGHEDDDKNTHDSTTCSDCKAGRDCSKKSRS